MLRAALGLIRPAALQTSVHLRAADMLTIVVTGTGPGGPSAGVDGPGPDFSVLRDSAGQAGIAVDVRPVQDGTRLACSLPLQPGPPVAD
jgi:hypothetical protein